MNNIALANEAIRITKEKKYFINDKEIHLPDEDYEEVIVITPDDGLNLLSEGLKNVETTGNVQDFGSEHGFLPGRKKVCSFTCYEFCKCP